MRLPCRVLWERKTSPEPYSLLYPLSQGSQLVKIFGENTCISPVGVIWPMWCSCVASVPFQWKLGTECWATQWVQHSGISAMPHQPSGWRSDHPDKGEMLSFWGIVCNATENKQPNHSFLFPRQATRLADLKIFFFPCVPSLLSSGFSERWRREGWSTAAWLRIPTPLLTIWRHYITHCEARLPLKQKHELCLCWRAAEGLLGPRGQTTPLSP